MVFTITSCDETTGPDSGTTPQPVTNLRATSLNDSTVKLVFTPSTSEGNTLFKEYEVAVKIGTEAKETLKFNKGVNSLEITKLVRGTKYTFDIVSVYTDGKKSLAASITWSPANMYSKNNNDAEIKMYEYVSDFGSGLSLFDASDNTPKTLKVTDGGNWHVGINSKVSTKLIFGSAKLLDFSFTTQPKTIVEILDTPFETVSLEELFDNKPMDDVTYESRYAERTFDLNTISGTKNLAFYVRLKNTSTSSYNYAKVLLVRTATGFLQGSTGNRYVQAIVSYQKTPNVPYAKTAGN